MKDSLSGILIEYQKKLKSEIARNEQLCSDCARLVDYHLNEYIEFVDKPATLTKIMKEFFYRNPEIYFSKEELILVTKKLKEKNLLESKNDHNIPVLFSFTMSYLTQKNVVKKEVIDNVTCYSKITVSG